MINETYLSNLDDVLKIRAIKTSGIRILALEDGYAKIVVPYKDNANHVDIMYAGSLAMLGELFGGIYWGVMFNVKEFFPIVKAFSIKFVRPATTDIFIEKKFEKAEALKIQEEAQNNGKCDYQMELELKTEDSTVVAVFNGIWQIRKLTHMPLTQQRVR
jgi:hypothetical protein